MYCPLFMLDRTLPFVLLFALQAMNDSINAYAAQALKGKASSMHLFSLQYSPDVFSKTVKDTWRWKDAVLGNGLDYFVTKPKTLGALQLCFQKSSSAACDSVEILEAVVLSNCARFEILVRTVNRTRIAETIIENDDSKVSHGKAVLHSLACTIAFQLGAFEKQPFPISPVLFDRPGAVRIHTGTLDGAVSPRIEEAVRDLSDLKYWTHLEGEEDILEHLCLVASGMALRPRRPERPVVFRPFSSRDAHILLQLKRTLVVSAKQSPRISLLLQHALQAGKNVRNADIVPEILELRQFGTGNSKYDSEPPAEVLSRVTQSARQKAILPVLEAGLERLNARDNSLSIALLRQNALRLAVSGQDRKLIQKRLHEPTLKLRKGECVNETAILFSIENELLSTR